MKLLLLVVIICLVWPDPLFFIRLSSFMIMFEYEPDLPLSNFGTKNINFINIVGLIELLLTNYTIQILWYLESITSVVVYFVNHEFKEINRTDTDSINHIPLPFFGILFVFLCYFLSNNKKIWTSQLMQIVSTLIS